MSQPQPAPAPIQAITVMCPECGELVEVHDPEGLIRALHLANACSVRSLITKEP